MAITERYADLGGSGSDLGTLANPWLTTTSVAANVVAGDRVNIKTSSRYTLPAQWSLSVAGSVTQPIYLRGYTTTITDGGSMLLASSGFDRVYITGANVYTENIDIESTGALGSAAYVHNGAGGGCRNLKVIKTTTGIYTSPVVQLDNVVLDNAYIEGYGNTSSSAYLLELSGAMASNCALVSVNGMGGANLSMGYQANTVSDILIYSKVSTTLEGIYVSGANNSHGSSIKGFTIDGFDKGITLNLLGAGSWDNVSHGIISGAVDAIETDEATSRCGVYMNTIAFYNNTNDYSSFDDNIVHNPIAVLVDPYTDSANDDFSPNDTAAGGALLKGAVGFAAGVLD